MKLVSKGVATATQFGDGVFIDSGIDWCAGDVKFPPEIRTAFPLIGVSNSLAKFQPPTRLHWGHDQHIVFHCDEDFLPTATQNIIDAVTHVRKCKCVVIVVGGNMGADLANVQSASEYGHPIIVLESTGGLADEIASTYREHERTGNYAAHTHWFFSKKIIYKSI